MAEPQVYLSGRFVPASEAVLSIFDGGLSGVCISDFCRTYQGKLFRPAQHLARFRRDCAACFIPLSISAEEWYTIANRIIEHLVQLPERSEDELALITLASPGPISPHPGPGTVVMYTIPLPAERYRRFFDEGIPLAIAGHHASDPDDLAPPRHKHRSRLHWWRAERLLAARSDVPPGAVAVLLDGPGGCLTETAIGNLLVVRDGIVRTPPIGSTLDGISLGVVRELCSALQIPFVEDYVPIADAVSAEEMMLTGTGFGLAGVSRFEATQFTWPGPLTCRLMQAWAELVERELG